MRASGPLPMESGWHLLFYVKEKVMPKINRNDQAATLSSDQFEAILAELTPVIRAVIQTARYTAARITEVLSLKWENMFEATVVIPKAVTKKKWRLAVSRWHPHSCENYTLGGPLGRPTTSASRINQITYFQDAWT